MVVEPFIGHVGADMVVEAFIGHVGADMVVEAFIGHVGADRVVEAFISLYSCLNITANALVHVSNGTQLQSPCITKVEKFTYIYRLLK